MQHGLVRGPAEPAAGVALADVPAPSADRHVEGELGGVRQPFGDGRRSSAFLGACGEAPVDDRLADPVELGVERAERGEPGDRLGIVVGGGRTRGRRVVVRHRTERVRTEHVVEQRERFGEPLDEENSLARLEMLPGGGEEPRRIPRVSARRGRAGEESRLHVAEMLPREIGLVAKEVGERGVTVRPAEVFEDPRRGVLADPRGDAPDLDREPRRALEMVGRERTLERMPETGDDDRPAPEAADDVVVEVTGDERVAVEILGLERDARRIEEARLRREAVVQITLEGGPARLGDVHEEDAPSSVHRMLDRSSRSRVIALLRDRVRFDGWWHSKIPPLLAVAYASVLRSGATPGEALPALAGVFASIACVAAYGHVVNDAFDVDADRAAGKPNAMAALSPPRRAALAAVFLTLGFVPAALLGYPIVGWILLALNYAWPTLYSLPATRLKERGLWGVAADAAGSHVTPTLLVLVVLADPSDAASAEPSAFAILSVAWASVLGIKGILYHQVADRENDEASETRTLATTAGAGRIERFLPWFNLAIEMPVSVALTAAVAIEMPLAVVALVVYAAIETIKWRLGFPFALSANPRTVRTSFPFVNDFFSVLWLPLAAAVSLALSSTAWLGLAPLHLLAFRRSARTEAEDVASVSRALARHVPVRRAGKRAGEA